MALPALALESLARDALNRPPMFHRLVCNGRGRAMTRPSWMDGPTFVAVLGERAQENAQFEDAPPVAPIQAPILSRVVILRNAFSQKLLVKNPYLSHHDEGSSSGIRTSFPEVERDYLSLCAQFGYVRYTQALVSPGIPLLKRVY
jgi:hypothetical protein